MIRKILPFSPFHPQTMILPIPKRKKRKKMKPNREPNGDFPYSVVREPNDFIAIIANLGFN
jgi:hypothetical protein